MIRKRSIRILGILYLVIGVLFVLNGSSITGFAVSEGLGATKGFLFFGLIFIGIGIILLNWRELIDGMESGNGTERMWVGHNRWKAIKPGSRSNNTIKNHQAKEIYRQKFHNEYGHNPQRLELRRYMRRAHESGEITDDLDEYIRPH